MKKNLSFLRKTFLLAFLMCLFSGAAFADDHLRTFDITATGNPAYMQSNDTKVLTFSAKYGSTAATLDYSKVKIVDSKGIEVVTVTGVDGSAAKGYKLVTSENDYFDGKTNYCQSATIKFEEGAWSVGTEAISRVNTVNAITVYDAIDFSWATSAIQINEGTSSKQLEVKALAHKSKVELTATLISDASKCVATITGTDYTGKALAKNTTRAITQDASGKFWLATDGFVQDNGSDYSVSIPKEIVTIAYPDATAPTYKSAASTATLDVWAMPTFTATGDNYFDVAANTFSFKVSGNLKAKQSYETGNELKYVGVYNKDAAKNTAMTVAATGLANDKFTVSTSDLAADGTITVTVTLAAGNVFTANNDVTVSIPAKAFKANGVELGGTSFTIKPVAVDWTAIAVANLADNSKTLNITVDPTLQGQKTTAAFVADNMPIYVVKTVKGVETVATYKTGDKATIANNVITIALDNTYNSGDNVKVRIPGGTLRTTASVENNSHELTVTIQKYITYNAPVITGIDDLATSLTFTLTATGTDGKVVTINESSVPVTIDATSYTATLVDGSYVISSMTPLKADIHKLNIANGAITVTGAYNSYKATSTPFEVLDNVEITITPSMKTKENVLFTVKATRPVDSKNVTSEISKNEVKYVTIDGYKYKASVDPSDKSKVYVAITEDWESAKDLEDGSYYKLPRHIITDWANNATNGTFQIDEKLIRCANSDNAAFNQPIGVTTFTVTAPSIISSFDKTIEYDVNGGDFAIYDASGISLKCNNKAVSATFSKNADGKLVASFTSALTADKACELTIKAYALYSTVDNGTLNYGNDIVVSKKANKQMTFADGTDTYAKFVQEYKDYDVVYTRTFPGTNTQSLVLPFDVDVKKLVDADGNSLQVLRLNNVEKNGETVTFGFTTVDPESETSTIYSGRPYLVKAPKAGEFKANISTVTVDQYNTGTVSSPTLKDVSDLKLTSSLTDGSVFTFVPTFEEFKVASDPTDNSNTYYAIPQSKENFVKMVKGNAVSPWRMYFTMSDPNAAIHYAKIVIDGIEVSGAEATGILNAITDAETNNNIYSVNGMRLRGAQKGINIINGKKVLVK